MATIQFKTGSGVPGSPLTAGEPAFDLTNHILYVGDGTTNTAIGAGAGSVSTVSVVTANGFTGTVANNTTTPAITMECTITGIIKGNGTAISAATSGTDYSAGTSGLATGIVKSTTSTGVLSIAIAADFPTLNQNTSGNAATVTTNANLTGPITSSGNATTIASQTGTGTTFAMSASPTFTGTPIAPTQSTGDTSTAIATDQFVATAISNAIAGINPAISVQAATTSAGNTSGLTYSNGVGGIGATLTGTVNTAITIDGFTFTAVNQRLLVKNDTQSPSGAFNGVYYLSQLQTVSLAPIFTRATDYNQPSDINNTGAIPVIKGSVNAVTSWLLTTTVATVGTDPLTYVQFSYGPSAIVTAVTGTTNRITSTGGTTPAIDISASYVGQSSITTLGTVVTGTWQGTALASAYVGTLSGGQVGLSGMASFAASSLMGNPTGSGATPSAITLGTSLSFSGTTINVAIVNGGSY